MARRSMLLRVAACSTLLGASAAFAGEIDLARAALRDGLWNVARTHALKAEGDAARLVLLESLAGEGRWRDILLRLAEWGEPADESFACWRAAALFRTGRREDAVKALDAAKIETAGARAFAARLRAQAAADAGDAAGALAILIRERASDVESRMLAADLRARTGGRKEAEALWRSVAASTNAPSRCVAVALANLGDAAALTNLAAQVRSSAVRRFAALRAGVLMLKDEKTFAHGAQLVRTSVRDAPDAPEAREAYVTLAAARLARGEWEGALADYANAVETWPALATDASVASGRGWALFKTGKYDAAVEAFTRAETQSSNVAFRAESAVKAGDALAAAGRIGDAMVRWREAVAKYPGTPAAGRARDIVRRRELEEKGRAYYKAYRFADAAKVFAELAKEDEARRPMFEFFDVLCLFGQGLDEAAEKKARELSEGCGDAAVRAAATLWLAKGAYNAGRWKDAEALFVAYAEACPKAADAADAIVWSARAAFAAGAFERTVQNVAKLLSGGTASPVRADGLLVQGEALLELARFDEAVLVFERAAAVPGVAADVRLRAQVLKADALFALGADNPARYEAALAAYRTLRQGEAADRDQILELSFKIARTLEKLKRTDEAVDQYYTQVVLAYREGRESGVAYGDAARAAFSRAALWLADEYESRGGGRQCERILALLAASDVPAAEEARRRLARLQAKGRFQ